MHPDIVEGKMVRLIVSFRGGQHSVCVCPIPWAQKTIQAFRNFLKFKYASPEAQKSGQAGTVLISWYMRGADSVEEAENLIANDPEYKNRIDWIIDMPEVCGMYIAEDPKSSDAEEVQTLMKEFLKEQLKPEAWKGGQ